jgi:DNA mismatch repair protein MutS2
MRLEVAVSELEAGGGEKPGGASGSSPAPVGTTSVPEVTPRFEADLRGLRVDEVELGLGRAVDAAVLGGLGELRIIHGKGTGAVKARVLELLPRDPRVQEFRPGGPGEGGGGVTVAVLR